MLERNKRERQRKENMLKLFFEFIKLIIAVISLTITILTYFFK